MVLKLSALIFLVIYPSLVVSQAQSLRQGFFSVANDSNRVEGRMHDTPGQNGVSGLKNSQRQLQNIDAFGKGSDPAPTKGKGGGNNPTPSAPIPPSKGKGKGVPSPTPPTPTPPGFSISNCRTYALSW